MAHILVLNDEGDVFLHSEYGVAEIYDPATDTEEDDFFVSVLNAIEEADSVKV